MSDGIFLRIELQRPMSRDTARLKTWQQRKLHGYMYQWLRTCLILASYLYFSVLCSVWHEQQKKQPGIPDYIVYVYLRTRGSIPTDIQ